MKARILNSTLFLLAAYFIVHFINVLSQYIILSFLSVEKLQLTFFYNTYLSPENHWWSRSKVFLVFGIGTFFVFLLLFLAIMLIVKLSRKKYRLQVFYNWLIIVAAAFVISSFFSATFFKELSPIFTVLSWLYFKNGGEGMYLVSIVMLPLIPFVAYYTNRTFLKMSNSTQWLRTKTKRFQFYVMTAFVPFIILTVVLSVFVSLIYNYSLRHALSSEGLKILVIAAILLFGAFFNFNKKYVSIQKSNTLHHLDLSLTIFIIVSIISSFVILWFNLV